MSKVNKDFYKLSVSEVAEALKVEPSQGLAKADAEKRLEIYGPNVFERGKKRTLLDSFFDQIRNPLIHILAIAFVVAMLLEEYMNAWIVVAALAINVIVGIIQEGRASKAFEKLAESQQKESKVRRDGVWRVIPAEAVVPGDVVSVEIGMNVPADMRLIEAHDLLLDESLLTGEWKSVMKSSSSIITDAEITVRTNIAFMGSLVVGGNGVGIVTRTGNDSEVGKIAQDLDAIETSETPVQRNLRELLSFLAKATGFLTAFIIIVSLLQGREIGEAALISIAIAVSVIPEGLPASITVVLAIGMETLMRKGGLVKNLLAAETLGSTTVILTDKTGTLTQASMSVKSLVTASNLHGASEFDIDNFSQDQRFLLTSALRSSDAYLTEIDGETVIEGRPVEKATVEAGMSLDLLKEALSKDHERIDLMTFQSKNRFAASLNKGPEGEVLYISGAPEVILDGAAKVFIEGETREFPEEMRREFAERIKRDSAQGMRMIGLAYRSSSQQELNEKRHSRAGELLEGSVFAGLICLEDPIRPDVPESIALAQSAGARVIMVTGDLPETAKNIAIQTGIATEDTPVVLGRDTENMSDEELLVALNTSTVFARVLPDQKLRISEVLKGAGEIVAMTGDGVNDAPALRNANIGIAVGSGTEVAKAASDLILVNNSFSIITEAIKEGRRIIDNLKKIIIYILSTNVSEAVTIVGSLLIGLQTPLIASQILWVNIIGEGFLNFALALEPGEKGSMKRSPVEMGSNAVMSKEVTSLLLIIGATTGLFLIGFYLALLSMGLGIDEIRTIFFIVISFGTSFYAFAFKSLEEPFYKIKVFANPVFLGAFLLNIVLLIASLVLPPLRTLLSLAPVTWSLVLLALGACLVNTTLIEMAKYMTTGRPARLRDAVVK